MVVNKPLMTPYFWGESIAKAQVFAFSAWWRFDRRPRVATWDAELAARGCRFPAACLWLHQSGCTETLGASQAEYQAAPLKINNQDERQSWRFGSGWFFFVNGSFLGSSRSFSRVSPTNRCTKSSAQLQATLTILVVESNLKIRLKQALTVRPKACHFTIQDKIDIECIYI